MHSAITHAIKKSGDVFQTVQLETIIQSARSNPYRVHLLDYDKFLDYKSMSRELRILQSRTEKVDWGDIMEVMVTAKYPDNKICHSKEEFSYILLERLPKPVSMFHPDQLYKERPKISKAKHEDLMKLCTGDTAVVKNPVHRQFYSDLSYENDTDI